MKKMLCVLMAVLLMMSGCAKDEEKKAVCKLETDGIVEEMTLNALNDQVLKTTSVMRLPFAMYEIETEEEKALFTEQMISGLEYDGITVETKSTEDEFVLEMTVDYETVSFEDLVLLGMIASEEADSEIVSFEKTLESLKLSGYSCE